MLLQQPTPALAVAGGGVVKEPEKNVEVQKEKLNNPPADTVVETPPAPQPPPVSTPIPPVDPRSVL
jgi:hypothetical protein